MTDEVNTINKAEVTIPAPGMKMHALKRKPNREVDLPDGNKRTMGDIHYEMYRKHPWVRAAIDKISKSAANPGYVFIASDPEENVVPLHKRKLTEFFRKSHAKKLLRMTYKDLLIFGEAFWWIDVSLGGTPLRAKRLHPKFMDAVLDESETEVVSWRYGPFHQDSEAIFYDANVIMHFSLDDPDSDLVGLSPLASLYETVSQDIFAMRYNRSFYENSAQTGIIFNMRNATADEVARNRVWLDENYVGAANAHRPIILEGDIAIDKSVSTSQEMEFIEGREVNRAEILGVFDLPPEKLGLNQDSNRSVSKESENSFRDDTIGPLQDIVEEEVNDRLILELFAWDDILFAHEESTPRMKLMNAQYYRDLVRDGLMARNEARRDMGKGTIDGGDVVTISTSAGVVPLERLLEKPDPATMAVAAPQVAPEDNESDGVNPNERTDDE